MIHVIYNELGLFYLTHLGNSIAYPHSAFVALGGPRSLIQGASVEMTQKLLWKILLAVATNDALIPSGLLDSTKYLDEC